MVGGEETTGWEGRAIGVSGWRPIKEDNLDHWAYLCNTQPDLYQVRRSSRFSRAGLMQALQQSGLVRLNPDTQLYETVAKCDAFDNIAQFARILGVHEPTENHASTNRTDE